MSDPPTIHASAVLVGPRAVLVRGAAGCGKSSLVLDLIAAGERGEFGITRLVADDRVIVTSSHGRLIAKCPPQIAGLIEIRGVGLRRVPYERQAVVDLVVDLGMSGERLPTPDEASVTISGVILPRLAVADPALAIRALRAARLTAATAQ